MIDILLVKIEKCSKPFNWPMAFGIFPTKFLLAMVSILSDEIFPKDGGIPPVRLFLET